MKNTGLYIENQSDRQLELNALIKQYSDTQKELELNKNRLKTLHYKIRKLTTEINEENNHENSND